MADNRDQIRIRLLSQLSDRYDKNPGNLPFELCQGEAIESESIRIMLEDALNQRFAATADFEHLKIIASEKGVDWKAATYASGTVKLTGSAGAIVTKGDLVANEKVNYIIQNSTVLDSTGIARVSVVCETAGIIGNTGVGTVTLFPKSLIGIDTVTNESAITGGFEAETKEELLKRYYIEVRTPGTSGNVADYEQWALSVTGVGTVKVKPIWNGAGTVKVILLDNTGGPAGQDLITKVKNYIETVRPIGPTVTVTTVDQLAINIDCSITLESGYNIDNVKQNISKLLEDYYKSESFTDGIVYYAKVGNIIYTAEGVKNINYSIFNINGAKNDIMLLDTNVTTQIAKVGTLNITA